MQVPPRTNGVGAAIHPHHWGDTTTAIQTTLQGRQCLTITFVNLTADPAPITWVCASVQAYTKHLHNLSANPNIRIVAHGTSMVAH